MTDQDLLTELQYWAVETPNAGASWPSGLWTVDELSGYLNQRQQQLLYESGCVLTRAPIPTVANTLRMPLPADWIQTRRVNFLDANGAFHPVLRSEVSSADYGLASWESTLAPTPLVFMEDITPSLQIQIAPGASDAGVLYLLYVALGAALSNAGIAFTVPDDLVPIVKWGVLADLFKKLGRAHDTERAGYAEQRFQVGVALVNNLLYGDPTGFDL